MSQNSTPTQDLEKAKISIIGQLGLIKLIFGWFLMFHPMDNSFVVPPTPPGSLSYEKGPGLEVLKQPIFFVIGSGLGIIVLLAIIAWPGKLI